MLYFTVLITVVCLLYLSVLCNCGKSSLILCDIFDICTCPRCNYVESGVISEQEDILHRQIQGKTDTSSKFCGMSRDTGNLNRLYRPRSALARALYDKQRNDRELRQIDKTEWYRVESSRLSAELRSKFVQLGPDRETKEFIADSTEKSSWIWTQIWYLLARLVLRYFWSITDINGWLGRGSMFVLSEEQIRTLCEDTWATRGTTAAGDAPPRCMVDVGAGDGEVTRRWAAVFDKLYATEISASMRKLLASKGFALLDAERWWTEKRDLSCVCMLNLLDRCSRPRTMLQQARTALASGGTLVLALVLPFKPYVEVNPDHKPEETMPITGVHFEDQVESFVQFMREEMSFELVKWTRVPYLCEGDVNQSYYWLDDSVYVFKPIEKS